MLWALSWIYAVYGNVAWIAAVFAGLKPAVLAIVAAAVVRIGGKVLKNKVMVCLAGLAFVGIFLFKVPYPILIGLAALVGLIVERRWKSQFLVLKGHGPEDVSGPSPTPISVGRSSRVLLIGLFLLWAPVVLAGYWLGPHHVLFQEGVFFSQAAMVTFGGAYAVLPYVSQQAVESHGWLSAPQMLDGLGLAETTPGPLIMVLQFVGFLGGWKFHEPLSPLACATLGAAMTTWTTFVPCFLWIFLGAQLELATTTETTVAKTLLERAIELGFDPSTLGADKGYHTKDFASFLREMGIAPHIAMVEGRKTPGLDARTTRHAGYKVSQVVRKRVEEIFGWGKSIGGLRKTRLIGLVKNKFNSYIIGTAYNLVRLANLLCPA